MAGIRVITSVKKIEVNDNGEYIELNFSDNSFPDRFYSMLENVQSRANDLQDQAAELEEKYGSDKFALEAQQAALYRHVHEDIMVEVDALFGPETCKKVFGDIVPGIELFDDFFTQLTPYFEEYGKDRIAKLSKYSAARTGNV